MADMVIKSGGEEEASAPSGGGSNSACNFTEADFNSMFEEKVRSNIS